MECVSLRNDSLILVIVKSYHPWLYWLHPSLSASLHGYLEDIGHCLNGVGAFQTQGN